MEKEKTQVRRANLFFIELVIALLFFSISAVIILRVFAAADNKQKTAKLTEGAILCGQSLAEAYSVCADRYEAAEMLFGQEFPQENSLTLEITLDDDFKPSENGRVTLALCETVKSETEAGKLAVMEISFTAGEQPLYSLSCSAYTPRKGDAA